MASLMKSAACTAASRVATTRAAVAKPVGLALPRPAVRAARKATVAPARKVATKAVPMEVAQLADEGGFIGGVALTMCAITLLGLAIGFVLLRVEGLVEEGKL